MEMTARGMGANEVLNESAEIGILSEREARKMYIQACDQVKWNGL